MSLFHGKNKHLLITIKTPQPRTKTKRRPNPSKTLAGKCG